MSKPRKKKRPPKRVLALPDLEQSKAAVLNTLTSKSGQRSYDRAITDFVGSFLNRSSMQPQLSISAWLLSAVSHLKLPIPVFSVRNSLRESDESRAYTGSEFALETG
jgi:hypothetical protein